MKITKKILTLAIAMILSFSVFAGCGGNSDVDDSEGVLNIFFMEAGYGTDFMTEWIKEYKKLDGKQNVVVKATYDVEASSKAANYLANPSENPYDLFLTGGIGFKTQAGIGNLEDISDVYASLSNPINPDFINVGMYKDKYYMMPWESGASGLVYNTDYLPEDKLPNTTDELVSLCADIVGGKVATAKGKKPFVWAGKNAGEYWAFLSDVWWAQYEYANGDGIEQYNKFWSLNDNDPNGYTVYQQDGILKSFTVLDALLKKEYCIHGSDTKEHTPAQSNFMSGESVMIPVGDWLQNEMKKNYADVKNYKLMKTPVISDLGKAIKIAGATATDAQHDAKLSSVIDMIDSGKTIDEIVSVEGVSKANAQRVIDARRLVANIGANHQAYIPSKSNAKAEAKDFMRFMSSDKAIEIFRAYAYADLPFTHAIDTSIERSPYIKSKDDVMACSTSLFPNYDASSIRYKAGLEKWNKIKDLEKQFYNDTATAQSVFDSNFAFFTPSGENRWDYYFSRR